MGEQVKVRVLRSVPVSDDGITSRQIVAGTDDEVPTGLYIGLFRERYVDPLDGSEVVAAPADEPVTDAPVVEPVVAAPAEGLEVRHAGRGKWYVVRGDDRVAGPFDGKEAAEAALLGLDT